MNLIRYYMTNASSNRLGLEMEIRKAFKSVPHPGANNIVRDPVRAEDSDIADAFGTKHWQELEPGFLAYHHEAPIFFTPQAFRFYLPAYLIASFEPEEVSGNVRPSLLFMLENVSEGVRDVLCPVADFTVEQRNAVRSYLQWLKNESLSPDQQSEIESVLVRWSGTEQL